MSYDIDIGDADFNYTWNMGPMFRAAMPPDGLTGLDGMSGRQAHNVLIQGLGRLAIERGADDAAFRRKYNAPNGWGDVDTATDLLIRLAAACDRRPRHRVRVT